MRILQPSAGQAVYHDFIVASTTCVAAKRLHCAFTVDGGLDPERLERAVRHVIACHESLRTSMANVDGQLAQVVREPSEITEAPVLRVDWDGTPQSTTKIIHDLDDWWTVSRELAVRVVVGSSPERRTLVVCAFNHACSDGISAELTVEQIRREYERPSGPARPEAFEQFTDYYQGMLQDGLDHAYDDWLRQVRSAAPAVPQWMLDQKLASPEVEIRIHDWQFSEESSELLHRLAREHLCTPFEALAACVGLYFRRPDDRPAAIGVIHSGRHRPRGFEVAGLLRSYVVDLVDLGGCPDVRSAVTARRDALRHGIPHFSRLPAEEVCRRAGLSTGWRAGDLGLWEVELNGMYDSTPGGTLDGFAVGQARTELSDEGRSENGGPVFLLSFGIAPDRIDAGLRFVDPPVSRELAARVAADLEAVVRFVQANPSESPNAAPAFHRAAAEPARRA